MIAIIMITLLSWFIYVTGSNKICAPAAALLLIAGVFTFSARMHERYLFPAVALALFTYIIYSQDRKLLFLAGGFSLTVYTNTHYILYNTSVGVHRTAFDLILAVTSFANILLFVCLIKVLFDIVRVNMNDTRK